MGRRRANSFAVTAAASVAAGVVGATAGDAFGATRPQVEAAAKRGVIIELRKAGIHFRAIDIVASCRRARRTVYVQERWVCRVRANGAQCAGTLAVVRRAGSPALLVREFRVACRE